MDEPILKYQRVGNFLQILFEDDSASCISLHPPIICIGTYSGAVYILDLHGNHIKTLQRHFKKVNEICIDGAGQVIGSCSDDGMVIINSLNFSDSSNPPSLTNIIDFYKKDSPMTTHKFDVTTYNYFSPVYSLQIQTSYATNREKLFITGGISGQLILNRKGWLMQREVIIHEGEGSVHSIKWNQSIIAWANDWGVKLYDIDKEQKIAYIEKPPTCPPQDLSGCHLIWKNTDTLLIGWADSIKVIRVYDSQEKDINATQVPKSAEIVRIIHMNGFISGLTVWDELTISAFVYKPHMDDGDDDSRIIEIEGEGGSCNIPMPELHLISFKNGKDFSVDAVPTKGYGQLRAIDYRLKGTFDILDTTSPIMFILAPKDLIIARSYDIDDQIDFSLEQKLYERSIELAMSHPLKLKRHGLKELVGWYLGDLFRQEKYEKAGSMCSSLLGDSKELWEYWVWTFAQKNQIPVIAKYMPTSAPRLHESQYEMVLKHFLDTSPQKLLETIRKWPKPKKYDNPTSTDTAPEYTETCSIFSPLYDAELWINRLESTLRRRRLSDDKKLVQSKSQENDEEKKQNIAYLMEALAELYIATEQFDQGLRIYLAQGTNCANKDNVFKLIVEHGLWKSAEEKILNLFLIDSKKSIRMLVNHIEHISIFSVVDELETKPVYQYGYLHHLFLNRYEDYNHEKYSKLHAKQLNLYVEFDQNSIMTFLNSSNYVPLEKAYDSCSSCDPPLWHAMVYLLGRMGNHHEALDLILNEIGSMTQAIEYIHDREKENDSIISSISDDRDSDLEKDKKNQRIILEPNITMIDINELYEYLIECSLCRRDFIESLLKVACSHKVDPRRIVAKIPEDMEIPNLKDIIMQIFENYRIQLAMCRGCHNIFQIDRSSLIKKWKDSRLKGFRVRGNLSCADCMLPLDSSSATAAVVKPSRIAVFRCGHCYHMACMMERSHQEKSIVRKQIDNDRENNLTYDFVDQLDCTTCKSREAFPNDIPYGPWRDTQLGLTKKGNIPELSHEAYESDKHWPWERMNYLTDDDLHEARIDVVKNTEESNVTPNL